MNILYFKYLSLSSFANDFYLKCVVNHIEYFSVERLYIFFFLPPSSLSLFCPFPFSFVSLFSTSCSFSGEFVNEKRNKMVPTNEWNSVPFLSTDIKGILVTCRNQLSLCRAQFSAKCPFFCLAPKAYDSVTPHCFFSVVSHMSHQHQCEC